VIVVKPYQILTNRFNHKEILHVLTVRFCFDLRTQRGKIRKRVKTNVENIYSWQTDHSV